MNLEDVNPLAIMPLESSGSLLTKSEMVLLNLINVYIINIYIYYICVCALEYINFQMFKR